MPISLIIEIEERAGGVYAAYLLLGISKATWYRYRNNEYIMPDYLRHSIQAHLALSNAEFKRLQTMRKTPA